MLQQNEKSTQNYYYYYCYYYYYYYYYYYDHRFEIYTLVSERHKNVDIVLGIKNVFALEGVINS